MKIDNLQIRDWGKVKATFSIVTEEGITIYNCRIVEGKNGLFVSLPREERSDGNWYDRVGMPRELKDELTETVIKKYNELSGNKDISNDDAFPF